MNKATAIAFLTACIFSAAVADEGRLMLRSYPVPPDVIETAIDARTASGETGDFVDMSGARVPATPEERDAMLMDFFRKAGVEFPEGAYVRYNPDSSRLLHMNTRRNQSLMSRLVGGYPIPHYVQIDAVAVDLPVEVVEALVRQSAEARPAPEDILRLWREGQGRLLDSVKAVARSGVNVQVQSVWEHIYPTEYEGQDPSVTNEPVEVGAALPTPGAFETREAGAILNVTPTVGPDGRSIDITMVMELCSEPEWGDITVAGVTARGESVRLTVPQPKFHSRNLTTSVVVDDGSTHVLGGMRNPQGDAITYVFLTATLVDSKGQAMAGYMEESAE